jgi:hypothetical protein
MKAKLLMTAAILGAVLLAPSGLGLAQVAKPMQGFMRQKLIYSQGVLEGITLEKFDLVLTNAALLRDMSQTNVYLRLGNPDYKEHSTSFQRSVDALKVAAKNKDLDAATKAYVRLTESCVDCHRLFRREQLHRRFEDKKGK